MLGHTVALATITYALAMLGFGTVGGCSSASLKELKSITSGAPSQVRSTVLPKALENESSLGPAFRSIPPGCRQGIVVRVVDGCTIDVQLLDRSLTSVRYIGVVIPENADHQPADFYSQMATAKNRELVEGQTVYLEKAEWETDDQGRLLRHVYRDDGLFVNLEVVRQGYAMAAPYPPDIRYQALFRRAEREAREAKRGFWAPVSE